jgi:hypothetical protein
VDSEARYPSNSLAGHRLARRPSRHRHRRDRPHLAEERGKMGGQIAPARAGGRHVHEAEQCGTELWVASQELHAAILEDAGAASAGRRLAGCDASPQRPYLRL